MIRLRTLLLYNYLYYILLVLVILLTCFRINIKATSNYSRNSTVFTGIITSFKIEGDLLSISLKDNTGESVNTNYYFKSKKEKERFINYFKLGDKLQVSGKFIRYKKSTTINTFDYSSYLKRKKFFYSIKIASITKICDNTNLIYILKNNIYKYFDSFKSRKYLKLILLGDNRYVSKDVISSFRENGISHLFAISGMHVGVITSIIINILLLFKVGEEKRYFITSIFLFIYLLLIGSSPSIVRAFLFFILSAINKVYYFNISSTNIFIVTLIICLLINPFYVYDVGFLYSFLISFSLIISSTFTEKYSNYFVKLFITSLISFFASIPVSLYQFYQINFLSIIYNLFYVPFVTFLLFPFSILVLIFPFLSFIYDFLINILVNSSLYISDISCFKVVFCKLNIIIYIFYFILCSLFLYTFFKRYLLIFIVVIVFHGFYPFIISSDYITILDVGQGDCSLIHLDNRTFLIDTGGHLNYYNKTWQQKNESSIVLNTTIPYMKSKGISRIDYLILTHGDEDHMGESINLVNNFSVSSVIFNRGKYNFLESKLKAVLNSKNIKYYKGFNEISTNRGWFYFLNSNIFDNENDNSNVIYFKYDKLKFLFMGDAGVKREMSILDNYNIYDIDFLKVGHHGSSSSSSKEFIKVISPKNCIISVGDGNKYNHPRRSVLNILKSCNIYRTDKLGSIEIKLLS